jgi:hypothetical protein
MEYTPQKAIADIDEVLNSNYDDALEHQLTTQDRELMEIIKSALEKQIPLEPQRKIKFGYLVGFPDFTLICPKCHKAIINTISEIQYKPNYCRYCGQALGWGSKNNG